MSRAFIGSQIRERCIRPGCGLMAREGDIYCSQCRVAVITYDINRETRMLWGVVRWAVLLAALALAIAYFR